MPWSTVGYFVAATTSGTVRTITLSGHAAGDICVVSAGNSLSTAAITLSAAGFTALTSGAIDNLVPQAYRMAAWWKVLDGSETTLVVTRPANTGIFVATATVYRGLYGPHVGPTTGYQAATWPTPVNWTPPIPACGPTDVAVFTAVISHGLGGADPWANGTWLGNATRGTAPTIYHGADEGATVGPTFAGMVNVAGRAGCLVFATSPPVTRGYRGIGLVRGSRG